MAEQESVYLWSTTALTNGSSDPAINFAENQLPSTVNNSARALMAAVARDKKDTNGSLTTAGSANAYTLTVNNTWTVYAGGQIISFKASFTNTAAATINVTNANASALGAKAIRMHGDIALAGSAILSGGHYLCQYDAAANSAAGAWILLNPSVSAAREVLTASRTYYVRDDGGNSNSGLANTAGGAFLTPQKLWDVLATLDFNAQQVTATLFDQGSVKTYTTSSTINALTGGGSLLIKGSSVVGNTVFNVTGADCFKVNNVGETAVNFDQITLKGGDLGLIHVLYQSQVSIGSAVYFDTASIAQIWIHDPQAIVLILSAFPHITGSATHFLFNNGGRAFIESCGFTLTGTPAYSGAFVTCINNGSVQLVSNVFGGSATGLRYNCSSGGVINSFGTGAAALPGSIAGTTADGGVYTGQRDTESPSTNDGAALGTGSLGWSDLFLANGGVINWNNGDLTATHSSGKLTLNGKMELAAGAVATPSMIGTGALTSGLSWPASNVVALSGNATEFLRVSSGGQGRASAFQAQITVAGNCLSFKGSGTSGSPNFLDFADSALTQCGAIICDQAAHTTAYSTSSDERGKPNREMLSPQRARKVVDDLKVWDFDKEGNVIRGVGVLAQEAYEVLPRMVTRGDDDASLTPTDDGYEGWTAERSYPVAYLIADAQETHREMIELRRELQELRALINKD